MSRLLLAAVLALLIRRQLVLSTPTFLNSTYITKLLAIYFASAYTTLSHVASERPTWTLTYMTHKIRGLYAGDL